MQLIADGLRDSKRHGFKAKGVFEECKSLKLAATEAADVLTLARLYRYLSRHAGKSFAAAVHELLDGVGFEKPPDTGSAEKPAPVSPPTAPQKRRKSASRSARQK